MIVSYSEAGLVGWVKVRRGGQGLKVSTWTTSREVSVLSSICLRLQVVEADAEGSGSVVELVGVVLALYEASASSIAVAGLG